jgi:predicted small lipoprotein YifL
MTRCRVAQGWIDRCGTRSFVRTPEPGRLLDPRLRPLFLYSARDHPESLVAAALSLLAGRGRLPALVAWLALALAACGRYGPLEPPPEANAPPKPASSTPGNLGSLARPTIPPIVPPKQPFFLDFLLK